MNEVKYDFFNCNDSGYSFSIFYNIDDIQVFPCCNYENEAHKKHKENLSKKEL